MKVKAATITLYDREDSRSAPAKTIHIFGINRGGTTAVAGIFEQLGVHLGEGLGNNLEDRAFFGDRSLVDMQQALRERDAARDLWGWKFPHSREYLEQLLPHVRNPRLVLVTRDMTANALGFVGWDSRDEQEAIDQWLKRTRDNIGLVRRLGLPTLVVSYEKLVLRPRRSVWEMANFVGLTPGDVRISEIASFVVPGRYRKRRGADAGEMSGSES